MGLGASRDVGIGNLEARRDAVPLGVLACKRAEILVDLDRGHLEPRYAREKTETGDAHARADVEHMLAWPCRHRGGEENRIASRPMTATRLHDVDAAAKKRVEARRAFPRRAPLRSCLLR